MATASATQYENENRACHQKVGHGDWMQDGTEAIVTLRTRTKDCGKAAVSKPRRDNKRRTLAIGAQGSGMFAQTGGGISGGT